MHSKLYAKSVRPALDHLRGRATAEIVARSLAILIAAASVMVVSWAIRKSYNELTVSPSLNLQAFGDHPKTYRFTILSVDELSGKAQANVQLIFRKESARIANSQKSLNESPLQVPNETFYFGPLEVRDIGPEFEAGGLLPLVLLPERPIVIEPRSGFTHEAPRPLEVELSVIGQPKVYPFDRYVVIGMAASDVLVSADQKRFEAVTGEHTEVYLRASGFILRKATDGELNEWPTAMKMAATQRDKQFELRVFQDYVKSTSKGEYFAVVLERPFFLRFFSIFLLVIAVSSMVFYFWLSEAKEFATQALGYFLGLWAARQVLVAGGPKTFTSVDSVILFLYCMLTACVIVKSFWSYRPHP